MARVSLEQSYLGPVGSYPQLNLSNTGGPQDHVSIRSFCNLPCLGPWNQNARSIPLNFESQRSQVPSPNQSQSRRLKKPTQPPSGITWNPKLFLKVGAFHKDQINHKTEPCTISYRIPNKVCFAAAPEGIWPRGRAELRGRGCDLGGRDVGAQALESWRWRGGVPKALGIAALQPSFPLMSSHLCTYSYVHMFMYMCVFQMYTYN